MNMFHLISVKTRACTFDTIVAQIQTLQGVIRANSFTKCLSTWQRQALSKPWRYIPWNAGGLIISYKFLL